jgi:hypothetical protein
LVTDPTDLRSDPGKAVRPRRRAEREIFAALRAGVLLTAVLILVGCDEVTITSPGPSTAVTSTLAPSPSPTPLVRGPDAVHFLADLAHPFVVPIGGDPAPWVPGHVVLPDGTAAVRYAIVPIDCPNLGQVVVTVDAPSSPDAWKDSMADDHMDIERWPEADATCMDGTRTATYLDLPYRPIQDEVPIRIGARVEGEPVKSTTLSVVPIYSSLDFERPAFTEGSRITMDKVKGAEKVRSAKPRLLASYDFGVAVLPDGTTATDWTSTVTGCAYDGEHPDAVVHVQMQVGDGEVFDIGECRGGGISYSDQSFELPPARPKISIFTMGGTTWSRIRVSEFQWRSVGGD